MFEAIAFYLFAFLTIAMFYINVTKSQALYALTALEAGMIYKLAFFFIYMSERVVSVPIVVLFGGFV